MNKQFNYRGYKFNIKIEPFASIERRMNGNAWHKITINCMDFDNYYRSKEVLDKELEKEISHEEETAKRYIDNKIDSGKTPIEQRLWKLDLINGERNK